MGSDLIGDPVLGPNDWVQVGDQVSWGSNATEEESAAFALRMAGECSPALRRIARRQTLDYVMSLEKGSAYLRQHRERRWRRLPCIATQTAVARLDPVVRICRGEARETRPRRGRTKRTSSSGGSDSDGSSDEPSERRCKAHGCDRLLGSNSRQRFCSEECRARDKQMRYRRRKGAAPRVLKQKPLPVLRPVSLAATKWWHDCPRCGVRNYTVPPNGVPNWHVPAACSCCSAALDREAVSA